MWQLVYWKGNFVLRTHTCGELNKAHIDQIVTLCGWARSIREHKGIIFVNLTDCYGWTQVCVSQEQAKLIGREDYLQIKGKVIPRPPESLNTKISTGEIELQCLEVNVINKCLKNLPFDIQDNLENVREEMRLQYRYLDLRRPIMHSRLRFRSRLVNAVRKSLEEQGFLEVETPLFVRSTPEGSRDFLVPSRTYPGKFYALPQSPQLYKQMLMIAGIDRYYQFPHCFRDEDARRERQVIHTQIDLEMSLVSQEDIFDIVEKMMVSAYKELFGIDLKTPFPHYTYAECMRRWGIDKPDLRFGVELVDFAQAVEGSGFSLLEEALQQKFYFKGIVAPGCANFTRKKLDELEAFAQTFKVKNLLAFKVQNGTLEGGASKKIKPEVLKKILEQSQAKDGDLILMSFGKFAAVHRAIAELRKRIGRELNLIDRTQLKFLWVTDFPLFEWDDEQNRWAPMHHMFTMPNPKFLDNMEQNLGDVTGILYDLVFNGVELGSGSLRITSPELQKRIMKIIGMSEEQAYERFGFLLDAYQYAAPTHGGMGIGLDNLTMTLLGLENIREVIAYPNSSAGMFLHDGNPAPVDQESLNELYIKLNLPESKPPENKA